MIRIGRVRVSGREHAVMLGQYRTDPTWSYWPTYGSKVGIDLLLEEAATYDQYGVLVDGGPLYAHLSINTHHDLLPGEFVLNHDMRGDDRLLAVLLDPEGDLPKLAGLFDDTGNRVAYGFVRNQPVWCLRHFEQRWPDWRKELER
jgi:hypothetical protein